VGGECSTHEDDEKRIQSRGRKPEGKRPLRIPGCVLDNNIKMDLMEKVGKVWTGFI